MKCILKFVATVHDISIEASVNHSEKHTFSKLLSIHQRSCFAVSLLCFGPGSLIPIEGMMNLDKYKDILANYLLLILSDSDSRAGRVFQQDLAPCHTSKKVQNSFGQTGIKLLDWPEKQFSVLYPRNCNLHIFNLSKIQIFFSAQKILTQLFTV